MPACWAFGCSTNYLAEIVDKLIKVDLQCTQATQTATATTLESEKDMEMNFILQALVKDIAEQLRPMVADMVRQELANADGENAMAGIAENVDLAALAVEIDAADLAGELTQSQLSDIAADVDLDDLANRIDVEKLTRHVDVGQVIRDWLADQTFSVRPY